MSLAPDPFPTATHSSHAVDADLQLLLRRTGPALDAALGALLSGDRIAARRVVGRDPIRHRAVRSLHDAAHAAGVRRCGPYRLREAMNRLLYVEDVVDVSVLVDQVSRQVVSGQLPDVTTGQREAVETLRAASLVRLAHLADGSAPDARTNGYLRCGQDLREAADTLTGSLPTVADLARSVLAASRHAAGGSVAPVR